MHRLKNWQLFAICVLTWGTTWFAITFQVGLMPPFNSLMDYMQGMARAVQKPYAAYEQIGLREGDLVKFQSPLGWREVEVVTITYA
mgnify:CR=1 FL=1